MMEASIHNKDPNLLDALASLQEEYQAHGIQTAIDTASAISRLSVRARHRAVSLSNAERHLLAVHESQCSEILRHAAYVALVRGHEGKAYFHLNEDSSRCLEEWQAPDHRTKVSQVLLNHSLRSHGDTRWAASTPEGNTRLSARLARESIALAPSWKT